MRKLRKLRRRRRCVRRPISASGALLNIQTLNERRVMRAEKMKMGKRVRECCTIEVIVPGRPPPTSATSGPATLSEPAHILVLGPRSPTQQCGAGKSCVWISTRYRARQGRPGQGRADGINFVTRSKIAMCVYEIRARLRHRVSH